MPKIIPIILCGGLGSRHTPTHPPKQFQKIVSDKPMLIETINRVQNAVFTNPIICGHCDFKEQTQSLLGKYAVPPLFEIYEPIRRNTAATITLALLKAQKIDSNALVLILPTDHQISQIDKFISIIKKSILNNELFIVFNSKIQYEETHYGYIEANSKNQIISFHEKPDYQTAQTYLNRPNMFWNTGIILGNTQKIIQEIEYYQSDMLKICQKILRDNFENFADLYAHCPAVSFDKAILEKTKNATTQTLDCGWSDILEKTITA